MHALRLRIILRSGDRELLEKRFRIVGRIHNIIVKYAMKQLRILRRNKEYRSLLKEYHSLKDDENRRKSIAKQLNEIIAEHRLTKGDIEKYASLQGGKYKNHLSSQQVQKEADRVYCGISTVLYSGGKRLHYKKLSDTTTICGKSASNGGKLYDAYHDYLPKSHDRSRLHDGFLWCGRYFWLDIDYSDPYIAGALNGGVSYCEVKRLFFDDGWHYYLNIYLKGEAPRRHAVGSGTMGIDYGTSTLTAVSEDKAMLRELAPNAGAYEKKIYKLQRKVDRSKRKLNPDNYNPDGTAKKGRRRWALSKNCRRYLNRIKALHRKKAAYVRQCHEEMANEMIAAASMFIAEPMDYAPLAKRAKETKRSDKEAVVRQKDGGEKRVFKYKRKRRFGRSINARAPAELASILIQKCRQYGLAYYEVDPWKYKASQYDHIADEYTKCALGDREKIIGGQKVQRDLYSAFLILNSNETFDYPDREKCINEFDRFVEITSAEIQKMKANGISRKACFGF